MKPLIQWTIRQRKASIIGWCLGILFFIFINLIFYPTIKHQSDQLNKSFNQIPQTAKQLFTDTGDLFSPVGYLSSQIFYLMLPLILGGLAINQGVSLIGKEERDGTIEILLARPLSRGRLLFGKAGAGGLIVLAVGLLSTLVTALMCQLAGLDVPAANVLEAGAVVIMLSMTFGVVAFMITALGRAGRAASIGITTVFALGGYIAVSLSSSVSWLKWPAKFFPFNYYHASELLTGRYNWANTVYFAGVTTACLVITWLVFRRRDLAGS